VNGWDDALWLSAMQAMAGSFTARGKKRLFARGLAGRDPKSLLLIS
jgi:hypothetical protein